MSATVSGARGDSNALAGTHAGAITYTSSGRPDYDGKDMLLLGILKGAVFFLSDLMRQLNIPAELDFMAISSYGSSTKSSGVVRILKDLDRPIEGRHVLIVEDMVDTGLTLRYLLGNLIARNPRSLDVCALLSKQEARSHRHRDGRELTGPERGTPDALTDELLPCPRAPGRRCPLPIALEQTTLPSRRSLLVSRNRRSLGDRYHGAPDFRSRTSAATGARRCGDP